MNKIRKIISITTVLAIMTYIFVLPASAVLLGENGFYYEYDNNDAILKEYHSSNQEVEIPSDVYSHPVVRIADYTFLRNTEITSVTVPETVTKIGNSAFYGCTNLESITIPASVTLFGNSVFANCEKLTIKCYTDSAAEIYAQNNNIPYELIDSSTPKPAPEPTPDKKIYKYGDIDNDGKINSADSLMILRRSVSLEKFTDIQDVLADVDGDGTITSADALDVLRYSVQLSVKSRVGDEVEM